MCKKVMKKFFSFKSFGPAGNISRMIRVHRHRLNCQMLRYTNGLVKGKRLKMQSILLVFKPKSFIMSLNLLSRYARVMMDRWLKIREFIKKEMAGEQIAGTDHLERAYEWCRKIGKERGADIGILLTAALLHDIGVPIDRKKHYEAALPKAGAFLVELGLKEDEIKRILHMIEAHSRYGGPTPQSLEAKILQDVDAIEYVGAVGLIRGIVRALHEGSFNGRIEDVPRLIDDLIKRVEGNFYTEEAKCIVEKRIAFLKLFSDRLKKELSGEE